jgi:hypothetical protein
MWQDTPRVLVVASLSFPLYYMGASWVMSIRRRRRQQGLRN